MEAWFCQDERMKFSLPPKLEAVRHTLARSHNRRVMLLLLLLTAFLLEGMRVSRHYHVGFFAVCVGGVLMVILGIIYIVRLSKNQSVALGFVCPLCGGALYDGASNRLGFRGECPRCKQFIIEKLNEKLA